MEKKVINVAILEHTFSLMSDQPEEHLQDLANNIEKSIKEAVKSGLSDPTKASLFLLLQYASELRVLRLSLLQQQQKSDDLMQRIASQDKILSAIL